MNFENFVWCFSFINSARQLEENLRKFDEQFWKVSERGNENSGYSEGHDNTEQSPGNQRIKGLRQASIVEVTRAQRGKTRTIRKIAARPGPRGTP